MDESLFDGLFEEFYLEAKEQLDRIETHLLDLRSAPYTRREEQLVVVRRDLHTIKGNSGMMGLTALQHGAHQLEDETAGLAADGDVGALLIGLDALRAELERVRARQATKGGAEPTPEGTTAAEEVGVRVPFSVVDALFERVSEMVIFRNRLDEAIARIGRRGGGSQPLWREVEVAYRELAPTLDFVQARITGLRMVPLGNLFSSWRRLVHDEAGRRSKQIELTSLGADTPIDKALLEVASEAVGHLLRNAVVHGIEAPARRAQAGKPPLGRIVIAASTRSDEVHIDIEDDGGGIDVAALERRAESLGLEIPHGFEGHALVFLPGLSTAEATDHSAGRGMGMSAVADAVRRRGGEVEVYSELGVGTRWRLRLPLTAAIVRALLVEVDRETYALPMLVVHETMAYDSASRATVAGAEVVRWRGDHLPVLDLGMALGSRSRPRASGRLVIVEAGHRRRALLVDDVIALREVVVKNLDEILAHPAGVSGCTILGDGQVAMILDTTTLTTPGPDTTRKSA